ncbi:hypothetical protein [Streptomyces sp. NPDC088785]|uniref:hypothetical protein n=1 Tax=Streptomyces sp. NPDC088785 TaxID=3365897 RepID=UPI0037F45043
MSGVFGVRPEKHGRRDAAGNEVDSFDQRESPDQPLQDERRAEIEEMAALVAGTDAALTASAAPKGGN